MNQRTYFENAIMEKIGTRENPYLIQEIQKKTKFIQEHQFADFICRLSEKREFFTKDEKFDAVVKEFENELKSELFAGVEEKANVLNGKLEALFRQIENLFSPNHETYDKAIVRRLSTPSGYIAEARIRGNNFWTTKDLQVVDSIGLNRCYTIYNSSYAKLDKAIEDEMKNLITKSLFLSDKKQISGVEIKRIGK